MAKISVIVPVYKVEKYLARCVESILNQTFQDFELILVDDGSPDNCPKFCNEYAKKYNNIHVIHKENGGLSDARNFGIEYALTTESEYITFIDSDDWVEKDYLITLYQLAVENNTLISACNYRQTNLEYNEEKEFTRIYSPEDFWLDFRLQVVAWMKLFNKSLWKELRFPYGKRNEDEFTTFYTIFSCDRISYSSKRLYNYFYNEEGIMRANWSTKMLDAFEAYDLQKAFFKSNNYDKAYMKTVYRIIHGLKDTINTLEKIENSEFSYIIPSLRKKLWKELKEHRIVYPLRAYLEFYQIAAPHKKKRLFILSKLSQKFTSLRGKK